MGELRNCEGFSLSRVTRYRERKYAGFWLFVCACIFKYYDALLISFSVHKMFVKSGNISIVIERDVKRSRTSVPQG